MENPLGYGIGRGSVTLGCTNPEGVETIDTYYLLILLEYGVLGFLIFYDLFLTGIWTAGRTLFDLGPTDREVSLLITLIIAMSNRLIIKSIFAQADNNTLIFAMLEIGRASCRARVCCYVSIPLVAVTFKPTLTTNT